MEIRDRLSRKNSWITCEGRKGKRKKEKETLAKKGKKDKKRK
jgi:hypothetical protein